MRRRFALVIAAVVSGSALLAGAVAAAGTGAPDAARGVPALARAAAAAARAGTPGGPWGTAIEVPGSNKLNLGGQDGINSVSCAASTNCSAGGSYTTGFNGRIPIVQAFVVSETAGVWRKAQEVPGSQVLNTAGSARINSVSCAAPGDCSAGGYYSDAFDHHQAFVVNETGGIWGSAQEVPGTAALNQGKPGATVLSVSCATPGDCTAGGYYSDAAGHQQAFVVNETGGTWGTAQEVPGSGALNTGGSAQINSVSCTAAGECSAGGHYASSSTSGIPSEQAMLVSESGGTWGTAKEVPGTAGLNTGGFAEIQSVSCASPGNCGAGGEYTTSAAATEAFVVTESGGTWGTAQEVPGIEALNKQQLAQVSSVACPAQGECSAVGFYQDASFNNQAFVVNETGGTWGTAEEIPGTAALDQSSPGAQAISVACPAAGYCSAGGGYTDASGFQQAFVVNESGGTWGTAEEVPGTAALNAGGLGATQALSCALGGRCAAVGTYTNSKTNGQAFAVNQTTGP